MAQEDQKTFVGGHRRFTWFGFRGSHSQSTRNRRRQSENRTGSFEAALSMSARREDRLETRQSRAGDRADADWTIDLFDRLNDVDAGEGKSKRRADPLDRRRSADHERPPNRGRVKRLAPEDRRELGAMQEIAQLRLRIGLALAVRRAVGARPDAAARGNDHQDSTLGRGDAPQFLEQRVWPVGRLQSVNQEETIDRAVPQGQHLRVHKGGGATPAARPDHYALLRRHQRQASLGAVPEPVEIRRSVTY